MVEDDRELVTAALGGQSKAFDALVLKYQKPVFNAALRMTNNYDEAQEVAQVAFVKAYENLSSYRPDYRFFSWLYRIVMNEALNHLERRRNHKRIDSGIVAPDSNPEEIYESNRLDSLVQGAIAELTPDYRAILVLKHFADLSMRELAYVFEIPVKTVKSRLYTARRNLCEILRKKGVRSGE